MSEHDAPASPPSGFAPFVKKSDPLDAAVKKWTEAMRGYLASALASGDVTFAFNTLRQPFDLVIGIAKLVFEGRDRDPMFKAFYEMVDAWNARQKKNEDEAFDSSLEKAKKLLVFAHEAVGEKLTEETMMELLAISGIPAEGKPDPVMAAFEKWVPNYLSAELGKHGVHVAHDHAAHDHMHRHHGVPDGADVPALQIDPTIVMQVLSFLVGQGLIDEDGSIEEQLWGAVQKAAAAQDAVRRA